MLDFMWSYSELLICIHNGILSVKLSMLPKCFFFFDNYILSYFNITVMGQVTNNKQMIE